MSLGSDTFPTVAPPEEHASPPSPGHGSSRLRGIFRWILQTWMMNNLLNDMWFNTRSFMAEVGHDAVMVTGIFTLLRVIVEVTRRVYLQWNHLQASYAPVDHAGYHARVDWHQERGHR